LALWADGIKKQKSSPIIGESRKDYGEKGKKVSMTRKFAAFGAKISRLESPGSKKTIPGEKLEGMERNQKTSSPSNWRPYEREKMGLRKDYRRMSQGSAKAAKKTPPNDGPP